MGQNAFVERLLDGMGPWPANHERIVAIELELGPNDRAAPAE